MTDETSRHKIGVISNVGIMHIGRRRSETFYCNTIIISPVEGIGDETVTGYFSDGRRSFQLRFRKDVDVVSVDIYPGGAQGTLTLGKRNYELLHGQLGLLCYEEHEVDITTERAYLDMFVRKTQDEIRS